MHPRMALEAAPCSYSEVPIDYGDVMMAVLEHSWERQAVAVEAAVETGRQ